MLKLNEKIPFLMSLPLVGFLMFIGCRPASYEITEKKLVNGDQPKNVADNQIATNLPPTARVEVIKDGISVTTIRVGDKVTIRPTADTVDADDIGKINCANPGIIKAEYTSGDGESPKKERSQGCEDLGVPHTYNNVGEVFITLKVTSNENETANASMTLKVLGPNDSLQNQDGGFTITADPMITQIGKPVSFKAFCQTVEANSISWTFGDGTKGEGKTTEHTYQKAGQYYVEAICKTTGGKTMKSSVTIVVMEGTPPTLPGSNPPSQNPPAPSVPNGPTPGTEPGQNPGQGGEPGQNPVTTPGQTPDPEDGDFSDLPDEEFSNFGNYYPYTPWYY